MSNPIIKVLLCDLDGTIRETVSGETFISEPSDQQPIAGAVEMLNQYHRDGWIIIGITNQLGVQTQRKSMRSCVSEQRFTLKMFPQIERIYFCPNDGRTAGIVKRNWLEKIPRWVEWLPYTDQYNYYRKPGPGMLSSALDWAWAKFAPNALQDSDLTGWMRGSVTGAIESGLLEVQMVGDMESDLNAAKGCGIPFTWASEWLQKTAAIQAPELEAVEGEQEWSLASAQFVATTDPEAHY